MDGRMQTRDGTYSVIELKTQEQHDLIITQEKNDWKRVCET